MSLKVWEVKIFSETFEWKLMDIVWKIWTIKNLKNCSEGKSFLKEKNVENQIDGNNQQMEK